MSIKKHGDTIIEVVFSFMVFATVSLASISIMNSGLNQAQRSLEITMARNEIDSQAEALRFLQNNFAAEREYSEENKQFSGIWEKIRDAKALDKIETVADDINQRFDSCDEVYRYQVNGYGSKAFVINTRLLQPKMVAGGISSKYDELVNLIVIPNNKNNSVQRPDPSNPLATKIMHVATTYPRFTYTTLKFSNELDDEGVLNRDSNDGVLKEKTMYREVLSAEGIWVLAVKGNKSGYLTQNAEYYDFYIRTCWQSVGTKAPSTMSTIIRLYNPEMIE